MLSPVTMLCISFKLVAVDTFEKKPSNSAMAWSSRVESGRVGSGRVGPGWVGMVRTGPAQHGYRFYIEKE